MFDPFSGSQTLIPEKNTIILSQMRLHMQLLKSGPLPPNEPISYSLQLRWSNPTMV